MKNNFGTIEISILNREEIEVGSVISQNNMENKGKGATFASLLGSGHNVLHTHIFHMRSYLKASKMCGVHF